MQRKKANDNCFITLTVATKRRIPAVCSFDWHVVQAREQGVDAFIEILFNISLSRRQLLRYAPRFRDDGDYFLLHTFQVSRHLKK